LKKGNNSLPKDNNLLTVYPLIDLLGEFSEYLSSVLSNNNPKSLYSMLHFHYYSMLNAMLNYQISKSGNIKEAADEMGMPRIQAYRIPKMLKKTRRQYLKAIEAQKSETETDTT